MKKSKGFCGDCLTEMPVPFKGAVVFCDDCSWAFISGGANSDLASQDLDAMNEFVVRNEISE